ncbi:hypothetical protein GCM10025865_15700 [Paraoerskovia sediminicola]|uniref:Amidohydrolase-related domain-containing protein n=1 Tax=Paraoerskovia sediminicola TaxID=1138587 RepID=A0ABN6XF78_9CELL|nr:amidohydrolase family protein [Paraoerskovia sediminicola]BDZ42271.1 hypothetical protein GCM10025865_15700 [Paraoerskovia sediminicola]
MQSPADLRLADWRPKSTLVRHETRVTRSRFPSVDVHNHLGRWLTDGAWAAPDVDALLAMMDAANVATVVNLDGMWGDELEANLDRYDRAHPDRFVTFCQLDWSLLATPDGEAALLASLDRSAATGARGVKVWKSLGLTVRDIDGTLIRPDDARVIRILAHAGDLGLRVLIHVADPIAFFEPLGPENERLDELVDNPGWSFADRTRYPSFDELLKALENLVLATPGTKYVGAHVGCAAEDLDRVERLLDAAPNYVVDIAGRLAELGRQPRRTAALLEAHPDRVLFGTDAYPLSVEQLETHFRFLETADEAFDYAPEDEIPPQGRWTISGLALPDELLARLYAGNARRVLGLDAQG